MTFSNLASARAFTLIELLVAISIFALVSMITFNGIDTAVKTRERITESRAREAEIEKAIAILTDDLMQLAPRPVRDVSGHLLPAYSYDDSSNQVADQQNYPLSFTRAGVPQIGLAYEHGLQRISYDYNSQTQQLIRIVWPVLDRTTISEPRIYPILSGVTAVNFRQIDDQLKEHNLWPPASFVTTSGKEQTPVNPFIHLPFAIKFSINLHDVGMVERIVPGVSAPYERQTKEESTSAKSTESVNK